MEPSILELISDVELAYMAGFFDGEGTIGITKCKSGVFGTDYRYRLYTSLTNTNPDIPYNLKELFGGRVVLRSQVSPYKDIYMWTANSSSAVKFIMTIMPYLRQKYTQAEIALDFNDTIHCDGRVRAPSQHTGNDKLYMDYLYGEMRAINRRGRQIEFTQEQNNV